MLQYETKNFIPQKLYFANNNKDFLLNENESVSNAELPGPGKYSTIDDLGTKYMSTKNRNAGGHSFRGRNRF